MKLFLFAALVASASATLVDPGEMECDGGAKTAAATVFCAGLLCTTGEFGATSTDCCVADTAYKQPCEDDESSSSCPATVDADSSATPPTVGKYYTAVADAKCAGTACASTDFAAANADATPAVVAGACCTTRNQMCSEGKLASVGSCSGTGVVDAKAGTLCAGNDCAATDFGDDTKTCCSAVQTCAAGKALQDAKRAAMTPPQTNTLFACDAGFKLTAAAKCAGLTCLMSEFGNAGTICCEADTAYKQPCSLDASSSSCPATVDADSSATPPTAGKYYTAVADAECAGTACASTDFAAANADATPAVVAGACCTTRNQLCSEGKAASVGSCSGTNVVDAAAGTLCAGNDCADTDFGDDTKTCCAKAETCVDGAARYTKYLADVAAAAAAAAATATGTGTTTGTGPDTGTKAAAGTIQASLSVLLAGLALAMFARH